jgi:hypothetical protein
MPVTRRITMRKIKDVLRLKLDANLSHERIAASLGISKGVVAKYVGLAGAAGLDWSTVQGLSEVELQRRLLGCVSQRASSFVTPEYGRIHQELRRKGMTLMLLWEEHVAQHPGQATHRYSQFCENYSPVRQDPQALDAPDPPRRREAVHRLRRPHCGAHRWQPCPHLRGCTWLTGSIVASARAAASFSRGSHLRMTLALMPRPSAIADTEAPGCRH